MSYYIEWSSKQKQSTCLKVILSLLYVYYLLLIWNSISGTEPNLKYKYIFLRNLSEYLKTSEEKVTQHFLQQIKKLVFIHYAP